MSTPPDQVVPIDIVALVARQVAAQAWRCFPYNACTLRPWMEHGPQPLVDHVDWRAGIWTE